MQNKSRVFVISDTHFGHKAIINFEGEKRPFSTIQEHDEALVTLWNETVTEHDIVYHLGDAVFGQANLPVLGRLNGKKILVMGNHDHYPVQKYLEYFHDVKGAVSMRGCIFTHIPVHRYQLERFKANVHGHLHSKSLEDFKYINVSAEVVGLRPVLLDKLLHDRGITND